MKITFKTEGCVPEEWEAHTITESGNTLILTNKDVGLCIPKKTLEKIEVELEK